jgi:DNA (cytosine-5)-methyltransferase 1
MPSFTFGSLFAGIGGFDLGLERAGMTCKFQVEIDDYCQRVLARHWPGIPKWRDIRDVRGSDLPPVDMLCGGFPCRDISAAGRGAGLDGEHSSLWFEYLRLIDETKASFVLIENSPLLRKRGLNRVLDGLAVLGYDAEWSVVSACALGAPFMRKRLFVLAYLNGLRELQQERRIGEQWGWVANGPTHATHAGDGGTELSLPEQERQHEGSTTQRGWWAVEPDVVRMVSGVPKRVDRIRALGNAVVPQVAEHIGRMILGGL